METFLAEHPKLLGEHLGSGDNVGVVQHLWRQLVLPKRGRLDILFLLEDGSSHVLYLAELKNEPIGKGAVKQLTGYLESWRLDANVRNRQKVSKWLEHHAEVSEEKAAAIALNVQGLLVAPIYSSEGIEALVERAKQEPTSPVQALKLLRYRAESGGYMVLMDDMFLRHRKGQRRSFRWVDLHKSIPNLVSEETPFVIEFATDTIEAMPDFIQGRGKNLRLAGTFRQRAIERLGRAEEMSAVICTNSTWSEWELTTLRSVHASIVQGDSISMSKLAFYLQRAFGGEKEPSHQVPAVLWRRRDEPRHFISALDAMLK